VADWNQLFEVAAGQEGHFTTAQAAAAGFSPPLLAHHVAANRLVRVIRGVYRLVQFRPAEHAELVPVWLWSEQKGIYSHSTALSLHQLSDVLPSEAHLTLPETWKRGRYRVPAATVLHFADIPPDEVAWFGPVPATKPRRTLIDCAHAHLAPDLLLQAAREAIQRRMCTKAELYEVDAALKPFGGLQEW
jgi:predicted transcriptional regulator of viral defense system